MTINYRSSNDSTSFFRVLLLGPKIHCPVVEEVSIDHIECRTQLEGLPEKIAETFPNTQHKITLINDPDK